ncbi:MAG: hypothetical protein MR458_09275, partial [Erysipelotrichaceae bacterium]|nr:hypothetical protein [Erysipelotrichaceae bacterium]
FKTTIDNSEMICIYGLSIGSTDSYYWKIIKQRLLRSTSLLIIYQYEKNYTNIHLYYTNALIEKTKRKFYVNSNATEEEIKKINDRIIVEINKKLFCV